MNVEVEAGLAGTTRYRPESINVTVFMFVESRCCFESPITTFAAYECKFVQGVQASSRFGLVITGAAPVERAHELAHADIHSHAHA